MFLEILFIGITAVVASFAGSLRNRIYIVYSTLFILIAYIFVAMLKQRYKRPFQKRFINEKQAILQIKKLLNSTKKELNILSKVGTTVFDLFDEYVELLQKESILVNIVLVDPTDDSLIELIE